MKLKWSTAEHFAPDILKSLSRRLARGCAHQHQLPGCRAAIGDGIEVTRQGKRDQSLVRVEERIDARNNPYYWLGFERILSNPPQGTDLRAIYEGRISITPLHMDLTHARTTNALNAALGTMPVKRPRRKA